MSTSLDFPGRKVWLDRRKPCDLWLSTGGGIFTFHLVIGRLSVCVDPKAGP